MSEIGRRGILKMLGTVPVAGLALSPAQALAAQEAAKGAAVARKGLPFAPKFFTPAEFRTARRGNQFGRFAVRSGAAKTSDQCWVRTTRC
jgi:hypothetical protein